MNSSVYFIECAGRIKIGFSTNFEKRLRSLATSAPAPLNVLGAVHGSKHLEAAIHKYLAEHRERLEWFADSEPVRAVIASLLRDGASAIGFIEPPAPEPLPVYVSPMKRATDRLEAVSNYYTLVGCSRKVLDKPIQRAIDRGFDSFRIALLKSEEGDDLFEIARNNINRLQDRLEGIVERLAPDLTRAARAAAKQSLPQAAA